MEKQKQYFFSADLIRAVAIIAVVVIHIFTDYVNNPHLFLTDKWWIINLVESAARIAVPLFVMLSGFLILQREKTYTLRQFLKKRVYKIGIPLLIWPLLYYLWKLFLHNQTFSFPDFINATIAMTTYYHLYYLYLIAGLYLITPVLKAFLNNAGKNTRVFFLLLTFLFSLSVTLTKYFSSVGINLGTVFTVFLPYICYYLAGDYLRGITFSKKMFLRLSGLYVFLTVLTAIGTAWHMHYVNWSTTVDLKSASYSRYFYDYLSITVVVMSLIAFVLLLNIPQYVSFLRNKRIQSSIRQIAVTSFGVYLVHPFIFAVCNRYVQRAIDFSSVPTLLFLVLKTSAIFLVSFLLVQIMIRIPYVRTLVS